MGSFVSYNSPSQESKKRQYTPNPYSSVSTSAPQQETRQRQPEQGWTTARAYGEIYKLADLDIGRARNAYDQLRQLQADPTSKYYNPYTRATNKSVAALNSYGIDTSNINQDWFNRYSYLNQYLHYDGTTNTPSKPGKNASAQEKAAYEFFQVWKSEEATKKAEQQWEALQKDITYWTQRSDRNLSDDEILGKIDWSKYGELLKMDENARFQPNEYNRAIGYSKDALYGVIWEARNPEYAGNIEAAMANSYLGRGNQYQYNPEIAEKLDPTSPNYKPYSLGSTNVDEAAAYFGVSSFEPDWCSTHTYLLNGSDEDKKFYQMVYNAEQTTQAAERAKEALDGWMSSRNWHDENKAKSELDEVLAAGKLYVKDGKYSTRKKTGWEEVDLSVLNKMDLSMGKGDNPPTGNLLGMTRGVDYKYSDALHNAYMTCAHNEQIGDGLKFINGVNDIISNPENNVSQAKPKKTYGGDYNGLRSKADDQYAEKMHADYERGQDINAAKQVNIPEGGYDDQMNDQYAAYAAKQQERYYSEADLANAAADDEKIRDATDATEGVATADETTVMQNAGSVTYGPVKEVAGKLFRSFFGVNELATSSLNEAERNYFDTAMDNSYMVGTYNNTEKRLAEKEPLLSDFESKWGDIRGYMDAAKGEYGHNQQVAIGSGLNVEYAYNPETHTYTIDRFYVPSMFDPDSEYDITPDMIFASPEENGLGYDREAVMKAVNDKLIELNETAIRAARAEEMYENASDEDKQLIDSMRNLAVQVDQDRKYLEENKAEYDERSAALAKSENGLRIVKTALGWLAGEDNKTEQTVAMLDYMSQFYDEPSLVCESQTHSQKLREFATYSDYNLTGEELSAALQSGLDETNKEIDMINMSLEWADENGYAVPDEVRNHMQQRLEDLEYERRGYEYEMISSKTNSEEMKMLSELGERLCRKRDHIINGFHSDVYQRTDLTYASDDEKELYYYLIGKKVAESGTDIDKLLEAGSFHTPTELHYAIDRFMTDADEYAAYMSDDDHGIWTGRRYDYLQEDAREMVDSGFWGGALANVGGTALTPIESIASAFYLLDRAVTGKRINPKSGSRSITAFKESTREATFASIDEVYKDNPIAKKLARLGFEIYSNRGDSVMNALAFGWMLPGEGIINNIVGAMPMGGTAALTAAAHAIERGATQEQAWAIAGATFLAETVTEGVTYSNIKKAFGTAENLSKETIKTFFRDWLTKEGFEEMLGESANDLIENAADMLIMQDASDHQALVNQYLAQNYSEEEAQWMARQDELKGVLHTAIVSYLSPGSDVFIKAGKAAVNTAKYYRSAAQFYQQTEEKNVSMWDLMLDDWRNRKHGVNEADTSTAMDQVTDKEAAVNPQYETDQSAETATSQDQMPAYAKKAKEDYERGQAAKEASEQEAGTAVPEATDEQKQTAAEVVGIEQARKADLSTKAAVMATVLADESKNGNDIRADAAAAFLTRVFGENGDQIVQEALTGAAKSNISPKKVKSAIKNAALGEGAATRLVQSDEFKNATPEEKARMLVETLPQDNADKKVSQNTNARIMDFRRARKMGALATQGHFEQAITAQQEASKAAQETAQAESDLEEKQGILDAAVENNKTVSEQFRKNPNNPNKKQKIDSVTRVKKADESRKQYEQHRDNKKAAQTRAEERAEKTISEAVRTAREIANQQIEEEDVAIAEQEAKKAEADRIAKEEAEQKRVADEMNENANEADSEAFIDRMYPNATEEEKAKVRQMMKEKSEQNRQQQAEQQAEQPAEQTAPESNEPTLNYNPNFTEQENKTIQRVYKKFNVPMLFKDTTETVNGRTIRSEGNYQPGTHQIVLDKNMSFEEVMTRILPHELLHSLEKAGSYNTVVNTMLGYIYGRGSTWSQAVENLKQNGGKATTTLEMDIMARKAFYDSQLGTDMSYEDAAKELAAWRMGYLFYDKNNPQRSQDLVNRLVADQPSVARQIMNSIKSMIKKALGMKGAWLSNAQKTVELFEQALRENNGQDIKSVQVNEAQPAATDSNGKVLTESLPGDTQTKYSLATWTEDEQARVKSDLLKRGFSEEDIDNWIKDANGIANLIASNKQRWDFAASDNQVFLKPNNDYYFTLDASTLCAKRLLYQGTFDYVQHAMPDEVFTPEDLIDLVNIMNEMGYETPCGICYVESRRRWLDTYANEFLDNVRNNEDGYVEKFIKNKFKKASEEEKAALRKRLAEELPSVDDLTTSDGLERLRKNDPVMYKAFVTAMNAKGSQNPKVVQLRTAYRGDIGKLTKKDIQKVKDIGGLRIQSFSDFETPHLLDMIQAVLDMSSAGLTSQAYTKVPNFAWVFGNTGIKINLSLIGKGTGLDENGNLVFDNREGMNFDEAMKLREKYNKNVGTILVGINDEHIIAAMGDPRIDYIIPFHKSGWSQEELRKMPTLNNYNDYTNTQNEVLIVGDRKHRVKEIKDMGEKALDNWILKEGDNHPGYRVIEQDNGKYTVSYDDGYETESFAKHKERTGESLSNFEPVGANKYWDFNESGEWNANKYLQMCAESGRIPKFSQFLVDNGDGSFSLPQGNDKRSTAIREGYWKTLVDFKMYENDGYGRTQEDGSKTEVKGSEQKEVTPDINMAEAYLVMNEYQLGRQMPDKANGAKGAFIPMKSNNDVPVAVPAAERYIELIRQRREGNKPVNPDDTLEASPSIDVGSLGESWFGKGPDEGAKTNAATAFGATDAPAELGNEGNEYVEPESRQMQMAIDENGETQTKVYSLPDALTDEDIDRFIDSMSTSELLSYIGLPDFGTTTEEDVEEAREIMTNAVKDLKDEFDPTIYNGRLYVKPKTMEHWLSGSGFASTNPNYAQAYITMMDPADFLRMTTTRAEAQQQILDEAAPLNNGTDTWGGDANLQASALRQPIQLQIDEANGKIVGHEGRHRSVALARAGVKQIPVLLFDTSTKYSKTYHPEMTLEGQNPAFDPSVRNGNKLTFKDVIPLSSGNHDEIMQRFTPSAEDEANAAANGQRVLKYSLPSDAPYLSAVDHGDMKTVERMVGEKAKESGYNVEGYHGTDAKFNQFKFGDIGYHIGTLEQAQSRMQQAGQRSTQNDRADHVMHLYAKLQNPLVIDHDFGDWHGKNVASMLLEVEQFEEGYDENAEEINAKLAEIARMPDGAYTDRVLREYLQSLGYDGIDYENQFEGVDRDEFGWADDFGRSYIVFDPGQLKSADPVTYDDNGNVIPLSERFQSDNPDIRYSLPSDDILEQQIADFLRNGGILSTAQQNRSSRPLEGRRPEMSNNKGPAQRQFGGQGGMLQESDEIDQQVKDYIARHNAYFPDTNEAQIKRAIQWIRGNKRTATSDGFNESIQAVTADNFDYRSADGQARMAAVMAMAVVRDDAMAQAVLADAFDRQGTDLGRALQARKLFRMMTPAGRQEMLQTMLQKYEAELSRKGIKVKPTLSQYVYEMAAQAQTEEEFRRAQLKAAQELASQTPASWQDKVRAIRMLSMLANPRTHIRNIIGNAMFIPAVGLKNKIGAMIELAKKPGERTKTLAPFLSKEARDFAREDANALKGLLTGEAKFNEMGMIQREQKAFKGLLQGLIDFNSNRLEGEDWIFLKGHYRRALGGWMMANGYSAADLQNNALLLEKGRNYAVQEAQKATYRDFNRTAAALNEMSRRGGFTGFLVDAVVPFKKTPANILRRGIEYSPIGLMRSITTDLAHLKEYNDYKAGKYMQMPEKAISPSQFIDRICSGMSGTMIMTMGALLSRLGIVTCGMGDDEDEFDKARGVQKYSIRIGNHTYTMDWAAPMSMPFFVGASIQQQLEDGMGFELDDLIDAFANISEPVFNLSMLDGINSVLKTSQYDDVNTLTQIGGKILSNYATSFAPSAVGAVTRTFFDDTQRKSYVSSDKSKGLTGMARYAIEQTENKLPGASKTNIPMRDIWGNEKKSGFLERLLENFVSPGYLEEVKDDPILNEMERVWEDTGDKDLIPSPDPAKKITYTKAGQKHEIYLTAEQWDLYKETRGKTAHDTLTELITSDGYKEASSEAQAEMIKNVWDYADKVGKHAVDPEYDLDQNENPVASATTKGKVTVYESDMITSLESGDYEGFETMVEALNQEGVENSQIKTKIGNKYRDKYKDAYRKYMETGNAQYLDTMEDISEKLDIVSETLDTSFDIEKWENDVDDKYGFNQ